MSWKFYRNSGLHEESLITWTQNQVNSNEIVNIMVKMHLRIGQFSDEQSNFVMGGSALKIDQGQIKESVKPQKTEVKIKEMLENDVRYTLRNLAKITDLSIYGTFI